MLTREGCATRQSRLLAHMERDRAGLFVTGNYRTIYYLTGSLSVAEAPCAFALWPDGRSTLVTAAAHPALADETRTVETYSIDRVIDRPDLDTARLLADALEGDVSLVSIERAGTPALIEGLIRDLWPDAVVRDGTEVILELRKRKEEDEIGEIRESLGLIEAAYDAARGAIAAGRTELDIYNEMQAAVVRKAGTFVPLAGDFAVGERAIRGGGPPSSRVIAEGDLYILDLFPAPHLYFGDTCRTFAAGAPSDDQHRAWEIVCEAMAIGERAIRPGVRARDVYAEMKEFLDSHPLAEKSFWHHAGHGIGHNGHEAPRIIPGSGDVFEAGDVITLEPGIYTRALRGGIRIEDNYVVRENELENLFQYPKNL